MDIMKIIVAIGGIFALLLLMIMVVGIYWFFHKIVLDIIGLENKPSWIAHALAIIFEICILCLSITVALSPI